MKRPVELFLHLCLGTLCIGALYILVARIACAPGVETADIDQNDGKRQVVTVKGRVAHIYQPQGNCTAKRAGIVVLHGSCSTAAKVFGLGFEAEAESHNFMVIYPEMEVPGSDDWGYDKDIDFFVALLSRLQAADFCLDPERTFVCGHSAGGSMSLFLQNEMPEFKAGAAVEAAVGHLDKWNLSNHGKRTMVVWNHADPTLEEYAPAGGEPAYYNLTVSTLRRHGSTAPSSRQPLPTSRSVVSADIVRFSPDAAPELLMLSWKSCPGTHAWPRKPGYTFDAAELLVKFFFQLETADKNNLWLLSQT